LQLIVESLSRAGQGSLFEQFLLLKAKLEAQGLFDSARKRQLPEMPRAIGLVTSLGAAALHDVITALQRRVPHIPVVLAPASVQGEGAPRELVKALESLYDMAQGKLLRGGEVQPIDVILLVRGGGAMEDLWGFNDEQLAHTLSASPVPVISGVGHETDFTIADFVADLRAPTPTAAAELVSASTDSYIRVLNECQARLRKSLTHTVQREAQQVDHIASRMGRPSGALTRQCAQVDSLQQRMAHALHSDVQRRRNAWLLLQQNLPRAAQQTLQRRQELLARAELRLQALDPARVLLRGYAWLTRDDGTAITGVAQVYAGQDLHATLADGTVDLRVQNAHHN
jgi:exodeoxyribonuclease VII large subunit